MALEVLAGKPVDRRSDIFSVGVVAWELLTGRRLFTAANEYDVITKIRQGATVPPSKLNPDVSPELDEIVMHALSRKRDERWPSAGVMKRALDTLRRTHREGPRDVNTWRLSLIPETEMHHEDSTTMELVSLRELMVNPSSPSITKTTKIKQADYEHYIPEIDDDAPTQMTVIPTAAHMAMASESLPALPVQLGTDTQFDALPRSSQESIAVAEEAAPAPDTIPAEDVLPKRDTLISQEVMRPIEDD
jgi:serine/threonine protein kinase